MLFVPLQAPGEISALPAKLLAVPTGVCWRLPWLDGGARMLQAVDIYGFGVVPGTGKEFSPLVRLLPEFGMLYCILPPKVLVALADPGIGPTAELVHELDAAAKVPLRLPAGLAATQDGDGTLPHGIDDTER